MYVAIIERTDGNWGLHTYASKESFMNDWDGANLNVVKDSINDNIGTVDGLDLVAEHNKGLVGLTNK